jgi:hypothetical protein
LNFLGHRPKSFFHRLLPFLSSPRPPAEIFLNPRTRGLNSSSPTGEIFSFPRPPAEIILHQRTRGLHSSSPAGEILSFTRPPAEIFLPDLIPGHTLQKIFCTWFQSGQRPEIGMLSIPNFRMCNKLITWEAELAQFVRAPHGRIKHKL